MLAVLLPRINVRLLHHPQSCICYPEIKLRKEAAVLVQDQIARPPEFWVESTFDL
jgi:hypothetical protein